MSFPCTTSAWTKNFHSFYLIRIRMSLLNSVVAINIWNLVYMSTFLQMRRYSTIEFFGKITWKQLLILLVMFFFFFSLVHRWYRWTLQLNAICIGFVIFDGLAKYFRYPFKIKFFWVQNWKFTHFCCSLYQLWFNLSNT